MLSLFASCHMLKQCFLLPKMDNKRFYNTEEALVKIFEPTSDSDWSDISDDEEMNFSQVVTQPRVGDNPETEDLQEEEVSNDDKSGEASINITSDGIEVCAENVKDTVENGNDGIKINITDFEKSVPRWRNNAPPLADMEFSGDEFELPPDDFDAWSPLTYFKLFWKDDINVLLSEQTNLYSVQRKGKSINTTDCEIQQFIGLQMFMSVLTLPSYRMYWANETRYPPIADVMSVNRYKIISESLHVSDNLQRDDPKNAANKLYKIQPVPGPCS